jgi:hypothetical protein
MAEADNETITSRFLTLLQVAKRIGREELELTLEEGRLFATDRENRALCRELDRFREDFILRGVSLADVDAVRAISQGDPIPLHSWQHWNDDGGVNWETSEIVRPYFDRALVLRPMLRSDQPGLLSVDVFTPSKRRPTKTTKQTDSPLATAINNRLDKGERPGDGGTVTWNQFCHDIRIDCGAFVGDPKHNKFKRGFSDDTIKRVARDLMRLRQA